MGDPDMACTAQKMQHDQHALSLIQLPDYQSCRLHRLHGRPSTVFCPQPMHQSHYSLGAGICNWQQSSCDIYIYILYHDID